MTADNPLTTKPWWRDPKTIPPRGGDAHMDDEAEIAAAVIEDLLFLIPPKKRAAVLAIAVKAEAAARRDRKKHGEFRIMSSAEMMAGFDTSPGLLYWHDIMRFKARVICTFVSNITNNHSRKVAAQLLFRHQPDVPGSGYLEEYLDDLPRDVKEGAA
jgi:hypothetical protein